MNAAAIKTRTIQFLIQTARGMWADVTPKEKRSFWRAPLNGALGNPLCRLEWNRKFPFRNAGVSGPITAKCSPRSLGEAQRGRSTLERAVLSVRVRQNGEAYIGLNYTSKWRRAHG
ncbi:unnamed protein product [Pleuronectes platessa]|uniref:Uncharacterized protein n=1 Tax=Pleuronectes platessa TaxID=8262 RepID=A0A9N7VQG7_PLEPL|nr:unnamed protein product [Pleuronectes platessa]